MVGMRVKAFLVLTVLVGLARSDFSTQNCRMEPDNSIDKVIEKNQGVKFTCDLDGGTVQVWLQTKHGMDFWPKIRKSCLFRVAVLHRTYYLLKLLSQIEPIYFLLIPKKSATPCLFFSELHLVALRTSERRHGLAWTWHFVHGISGRFRPALWERKPDYVSVDVDRVRHHGQQHQAGRYWTLEASRVRPLRHHSSGHL